jgi:hypothetical protein
MRNLSFGLLTALAMSGTAGAQDFAHFVGGSPAFIESRAMFQGKPVTTVRISAYFHHPGFLQINRTRPHYSPFIYLNFANELRHGQYRR